MSQKYGPTDRYEILPGEVRDRHVPTGELHGGKLQDLSVKRSKIDDYAVNEDKIPTGELTYRSMKTDSGLSSSTPDTDTEIAHGLGVTPSELVLVPQTTAVIGYALESARSATSITIRASTSGVDIKWSVIG